MPRIRRNEWNFSANAAHVITEILQRPEYADSPLGRAEAELTEYHGVRRLDLVIFHRHEDDVPLVTGELKLPWSAEGRTPYNSTERDNAHGKATRVGSLYFVTWNITRAVVWKTDDPGVPLDRRVVYDNEMVSVPLRRADDLGRDDVRRELAQGIERLVAFLHSIVTGPPAPKFLPLDEIFIATVEAALDFPIKATVDAVNAEATSSAKFKRQLEAWMRDEQGWIVSQTTHDDNVANAARFSCYVLLNRLCFYNVLRRRYDLDRLRVANNVNTGARLKATLKRAFSTAERYTGDYETVFDTRFGDELPFLADETASHWRDIVRLLDTYDFASIDQEVIGRMYEKLIQPSERHRYGQHYTQPAVVDLIGSFALHSGEVHVLDPACGGGTFLVRAYARKRSLDSDLDHVTLLHGLYGCDILNYACHLTTINLAVRDLIDDDNFPIVHHGDFLKLKPEDVFHDQPLRIQAGGLTTGRRQLRIHPRMFEAIVGNPPYIQARTIPAHSRDRYFSDACARFPRYEWSRASDIYVYFWLHSEQFLHDNGVLALLTQSGWLDVEYGTPLQKWMLDNFRIVAVLESDTEAWFTDARVATAVTVLEREPNADRRDNNSVRFVTFHSRLERMLGADATDDERQTAADRLRELICRVRSDVSTDDYRVRLVKQSELEAAGTDHDGTYQGSKWGRFLRSTQTVYNLYRDHAERTVRLDELADIRRGVTTNCDSFFLVEDISSQALTECTSDRRFRDRFGTARASVARGEIAVIRRRDEFVAALPRICLRPVIRTARDFDRFRTSDYERLEVTVVIRSARSALGALERRYIEAGERERWHQAPSFVQAAEAGRDWYELRDTEVSPILS